jgi:hypothetical protein
MQTAYLDHIWTSTCGGWYFAVDLAVVVTGSCECGMVQCSCCGLPVGLFTGALSGSSRTTVRCSSCTGSRGSLRCILQQMRGSEGSMNAALFADAAASAVVGLPAWQLSCMSGNTR